MVDYGETNTCNNVGQSSGVKPWFFSHYLLPKSLKDYYYFFLNKNTVAPFEK